MSTPTNSDRRATRVASYRNLTEREIRARLEGPLSDAERVTAQAEMLRRGAGDDEAPDTAFATGFAPTGASDFGTVESEVAPELLAHAEGVDIERTRPSRRLWPVVGVLALAVAGGVAWVLHAGLMHP